MSEFVKLNLAEKDWVFRALDLDQLEALEPQFEALAGVDRTNGMPSREMLSAVAEIAAESLRFKHPEITAQQCRKLVTVGTMQRVMDAIKGVSALEPAPGEA